MSEHGTHSRYAHGCRCRKCGRAEAVYNVDRKRIREGGRGSRQVRRGKPQYESTPLWLDDARCRGDDRFFERCCATSKREQLAYTPWLRAYCNSCPVRVKCDADVFHWESFHPDDMRALFQAGRWPHERTAAARRRRVRGQEAERAFETLRGALG